MDETKIITLAVLKEYDKYKQDLLKSGINIKTINGASILGSGDIEIDIPQNISAFINDAKYVDEDTLESSMSDVGAKIELAIDAQTFELKALLKNSKDETISTSNVIDLPLESMVIGATYDDATNELVLKLQNGTETRVPVAKIIEGLATEEYVDSKIAELEDDKFDSIDYVETKEDEQVEARFTTKKGDILGKVVLENNLTSTDKNAALAAPQGIIVNARLEDLESRKMIPTTNSEILAIVKGGE